MTLRSLLFVPGNRPERFDKAAASGADAIILDLEDAVATPDKAHARDAVAAWLRAHIAWLAAPSAGHPLVLVRINAFGTPWFEADVQACAAAGLREWMLPKSEHTTQLQLLQALPQAGIWPLIESAQGMAHLQQLAAAASVRRLVFGSLDFQVDMGMEADAQETELAYYRAQLVLASRVAGLSAPVDGVSTALDDRAGLAQATQRAVRQGFAAKLCIHPQQIAVVHAAMTPSAAAIAQAQQVLAAAEATNGAAVALHGAMVDRPVILHAQTVLTRAGLAFSETSR